MGSKRNQLSDIEKKHIIESLRSGELTLKELEVKKGITKYQVERWQAKFMAQALAAGKPIDAPVVVTKPLGEPKSHSNGNGNGKHSNGSGHGLAHKSVSGDPRDRLIMQLQIKVANQMLEIDKLKAELYGNKRYADRELYLDNQRESD